ncbi:hypothetical protein OAW24_00490 [bacterium]|nr:hypothetical protein [bacterium]
MSYKSENWQDKLAEVRNSIVSKEGSVEKTADEIINEEIEAELKSFFAEEPVELDEIKQQEVDALKKLSKDMQAVLKGYQKIVKMGDNELKDKKYNKDYEAVLKARDVIFTLIGKVNTQKTLNKEEVVVEEKLSLEKTISKLTEKNMLGRLAKSMELNEDNKDKLFNYFDKGELKQ